MKVLFLHKWLLMGGIERILINYLKLLSNDKNISINVLIAYDTSNNVFHKEIPSNINIYYIFDKEYFNHSLLIYQNRKKSLKKNLINKFYKIKEKYLCRKKTHQFITDNNYDIIINFSDHFDNYLKFNQLNIPIIRWQHLAPNPNEEIPYKKIKILRKYRKIITICDEMKKEMRKITNFPNEKYAILFNPIGFDNVIELSNKKMELINNNEEYIIQVARLDKIKRHEDLINIYYELSKKGIKEKLYILGYGKEYENLKSLINKLELNDKCILLGEVKNPYPYIKNAKLFLHTSEREGLPTVLLESLILNTPVISTDCPTGPKEILSFGAGKLIPLGNQEKFIKEAFNLLTNPEQLEACKGKIPDTLSHFSEENIKKQFISLLKEQIEK
ncbi:MAG: glycosyltransferase [Lonepinella koalarum]|nr:glycosyltransferase [Lonepinella koalarum]